jgi:hypothetical protein
VENPSEQAGVIDVDVIPSPEPVSPTPIEEQEPVTEKMDVDPRMKRKTPLKHKTLHNNWVWEHHNRKMGKMMKEQNLMSLGQRPNQYRTSHRDNTKQRNNMCK